MAKAERLGGKRREKRRKLRDDKIKKKSCKWKGKSTKKRNEMKHCARSKICFFYFLDVLEVQICNVHLLNWIVSIIGPQLDKLYSLRKMGKRRKDKKSEKSEEERRRKKKNKNSREEKKEKWREEKKNQ